MEFGKIVKVYDAFGKINYLNIHVSLTFLDKQIV